jgi:DNA-binding response OmpR family regulator
MIDMQTIYKETKHLSVLFVEDDADLRMRTMDILEDFFYRIDCAVDGADALEKFKHYHELKHSYYDIVISDIQMPRMDGIGLTAALYALREDQPIIILSAYTDTEYLLTLINFGVAQFITKPLQYQEMLNTLYKVSKKINSTPKATAAKDSHIISLSNSVVWDKEKKLLIDNGVNIALSKYEIYLMDVLSLKFEQVCSNDEILSHFFLHGIDTGSENIRMMMMRLRKKLPSNTLSSIYGLGYRLSNTSEE